MAMFNTLTNVISNPQQMVQSQWQKFFIYLTFTSGGTDEGTRLHVKNHYHLFHIQLLKEGIKEPHKQSWTLPSNL